MLTMTHRKHSKQHTLRRPHLPLSLRPSAVASLLDLARRALLLLVAAGACAIIITETFSFYRQRDTRIAITEYRAAINGLANTIRVMRSKAITLRQPFELRVDQKHNSITVSALSSGARGYSELEGTLWLAQGLEIVDAPLWVTAQSNGSLTPSRFVIVAPALQRLFRLQTTLSGTVELHEEPTS